MKRYEALAQQLAEMIRSGVLLPGDKAPSVRTASARFGVSPSTVFKAYYQLESQGLIRARERSGYYVCDNAGDDLPQLSPTRPQSESTEVNVNDLVFSILDQAAESGLVPLGSAFPDIGLFPLGKLGQSLSRANRADSGNANLTNLSPGNEALRRAIAARYMSAGVSVSASDIIITNGALEGLTLALRTLTRPGDTVAIESPGFYAALQIIQMLNLRAVEIPMDPHEGLDLQALEDVLGNERISACWCMTNFQNPIGSTMPDSKKQALVALLAEHAVPLIEDDVYSELYFGSQYFPPAKKYDHQGLVLHCGSFSKSLAPGYRIGWIIAGRFYEQIRRAKLATSLSASVPAQLALAHYLQQGLYDRHLRKLRITLEGLQASMVAAIAAHFPQGTRVSRPRGGYFLWLELPRGVDALALYRIAMQEGISFAPGPMFSASRAYAGFLRLNYGIPGDDAQRAVARLGVIATQLAQQATDVAAK